MFDDDSSKIREAFSFLELEEIDQKEFQDLYDKIKASEASEDKEVSIAPDSKLAARSWALALAHLDDKNEWLKEYQKKMEARYVKPTKDEIERNDRAKEVLKMGLKQFLENAEEKNVKFPDVGTISRYSPPDKIVYPEDEFELAKEIFEQGNENEKKFVKLDYCFDKNAVKKAYGESGTLPLPKLDVEKQLESVRFQRSREPKA